MPASKRFDGAPLHVEMTREMRADIDALSIRLETNRSAFVRRAIRREIAIQTAALDSEGDDDAR